MLHKLKHSFKEYLILQKIASEKKETKTCTKFLHSLQTLISYFLTKMLPWKSFKFLIPCKSVNSYWPRVIQKNHIW